MIKLEKTEVCGWEPSIRGMRNPMNSWDKSDTHSLHIEYCNDPDDYNLALVCGDYAPIVGPNDHDLMMKLRHAGTDHRKCMRMITVYVDITAPLYWWKEFDTYKVGTVANSCSTMHKIHEKEFELEDFSCEHLTDGVVGIDELYNPFKHFCNTVSCLNNCRIAYLQTKDKKYWWNMIQLLPSSYNQKRTIMLNYEVLANIYKSRKGHKLDEWREFCKWIESLPYSEIITGSASLEDKKNGWRLISEYDESKYDWVLVKMFDGDYECIPIVAERRMNGKWYSSDDVELPFEVRYFFDMQQIG